jgi:hypothetical protein
LKRVLIVLGAVAAWCALAAPAGAITPRSGATNSGASASTTTTAPIQPVVTPLQRAPAGLPLTGVTAQGSPLVGVFAFTAGSCSSNTPTGTYFQMIEPGGSLTGPFLSNANSPCSNQTYTPLSPGTAGGLSTVTYQPNPSPAFNGSGDGLADTITQPQEFFGVNFALSTNSTDPQTGQSVSIPSVSNSGGTLSGNLEAISVAWNNQDFNQGSPKPGGSTPGLTTAPTGTYDASSGAFALNWSSAIVGGPFNSFTGLWHLEGTFIPSSSPPSTTTTTTSPTGSSGPAPTGSHTSSSTHPSTTTAVVGAQQGSGTPGDPSSGASTPLAMTGIPQDTKNLLLVALAMSVSGICLLLTQKLTKRARSRKVAR